MDEDILELLNELMTKKSSYFGDDLIVDIVSFTAPFQVKCILRDIGECVFNNEDAVYFLQYPVEALASAKSLSVEELKSIYQKNDR